LNICTSSFKLSSVRTWLNEQIFIVASKFRWVILFLLAVRIWTSRKSFSLLLQLMMVYTCSSMQFFNIVFRIVQHFQSEGKFSERGKKRKKRLYLTIENHVRYKHCIDSDIKFRNSKALLRYQKITFRMETQYSCTLVSLPRLSPIGKIVHLIGDNFKAFFFWQIGKLSLGETAEFRR
jgi:hypothetical protein